VARGRVPRKDAAGQAPSRRTTFTGRAGLLALVVCALALSLAYPIQRYVDQRQQIDGLQDEVSARTERVRVLEEQLQRWRDPAFVRQEARRRLHFVMPGETGYIVIGPEGRPAWDGTAAGTLASGNAAAGAAGGTAGGTARPWFERLWGSVDAAARAPADDGATPARRPATHIGPGKDSGTDSGG